MLWGFGAGELALAPGLPRALERAAAAGFGLWEVTGEGPFASLEGLAPALAAVPSFPFRVTYHASFRRVDLASPDPVARARDVALVQGQLGLARGLGAGAVVVHPGSRIRGLEDPRAGERAAGSLRALARAAADLGLELRVENMPRGPEELAQSPEDLAPLAEAAGAACWDLGHERTLAAPPDLAPVQARVREVHLHDNAGRGDDHRPLSPASAWVPARWASLARPGLPVVLEHRRLDDCISSLAQARTLLP